VVTLLLDAKADVNHANIVRHLFALWSIYRHRCIDRNLLFSILHQRQILVGISIIIFLNFRNEKIVSV
jgi:hypothetical protein